MTFQFRGVQMREINGLPYAVHQIGDDEWQIVIENCQRHPAGYTFAPVYGAREEASQALQLWPAGDAMRVSQVAGDDTGAAELAYYED